MKLEMELRICKKCGAVFGVPNAEAYIHVPCEEAMEPLHAALRADGQSIVFYTDEIAQEAIDKKV